MGNESSSNLTGFKLDDKAIEVTDFWIHHTAKITKSEYSQDLSVFVSDYVICGTLWDKSPLEKYTKSLMLYRHPCILKYISSWNKGSKYYLVVEKVRPLSHVLVTQSTIQICIGLYSILKALIFLHNKGHVTHNNICSASIYVTQDGSWKLGGLEFLCKYTSLTKEYLTKSRSHRYENAIDSNEDKYLQDESVEPDFIDLYAFGVLAEEILRKRLDDETLDGIKVFYDFCKNEMQSSDIKKRPKFSEVISHSFFNHEFVNIYTFLNELPLKTETEKGKFFSNLTEKLKTFPEDVVAENLGDLLLSRLVLLDFTARKEVLPILLCPREEGDSNNSIYLFSNETFKKYLVPKLLQIFKVTDLQIRELLLSHFKNFISCFSKEQLKNYILPELLLGIKDRNDNLVAMTLRSLADLVPILGAETVIGGKRAKLFSDGRPLAHNETKPPPTLRLTSHHKHHMEHREPSLPVLLEIPSEENEDIKDAVTESLSERPSPDGGEDHLSTSEDIDTNNPNEDLDWSDWDIHESSDEFTVKDNTSTHEMITIDEPDLSLKIESNIPPEVLKNRAIVLPDISELDIKNQSSKVLNNNSKKTTDDINFFQDMEPVIQCTNKFLINDVGGVKNNGPDINNTIVDNSNFSVKSDLVIPEADGWSEELDWNIDNN